MDAIYLSVNGQQTGPFTLDQIRHSLSKGEISRETHAWHEGLTEWSTVGVLLDKASGLAVTPAPTAVQPEAVGVFTNDQLRSIAKSQTLFICAVLASICSNIAYRVYPDASVILLIALAVVAFEIYALWRLGSSLRLSPVLLVFLCLGMFIPCVSLIILVMLSGRASKILKAAGVRVGLMGGRAEDIKD